MVSSKNEFSAYAVNRQPVWTDEDAVISAICCPCYNERGSQSGGVEITRLSWEASIMVVVLGELCAAYHHNLLVWLSERKIHFYHAVDIASADDNYMNGSLYFLCDTELYFAVASDLGSKVVVELVGDSAIENYDCRRYLTVFNSVVALTGEYARDVVILETVYNYWTSVDKISQIMGDDC